MPYCTEISLLFERGVVWTGESSHINSAPSAAAATFGISEIDCELALGGLGYGAIHEWLVSPDAANKIFAPTLLTTSLAAQAASKQKYLIWIGRESWPSPFLIEKFYQNCLFIDPQNEKLKLWAFDTALRSPAVAAVTLFAPKIHPAISRRLAHAAKSGTALGFIISDATKAYTVSMAQTRWKVLPLPNTTTHQAGFSLELLKQKGRFARNNYWEISAEALSLRLLSGVVDRSRTQENAQKRAA